MPKWWPKRSARTWPESMSHEVVYQPNFAFSPWCGAWCGLDAEIVPGGGVGRWCEKTKAYIERGDCPGERDTR